jgi:hypothetical protein
MSPIAASMQRRTGQAEMILAMDDRSEVTWSSDASPADWIGARLGEFGGGVTSVVPSGFEAYARILHPADSVGERGPVRWGDVAKWSGLPLRPTGLFHSVALPPEAPLNEPPWHGRPRQGTLIASDAKRLVVLLRPWTSTPDECWFAVWDGYGWQDSNSPRVHLPYRDYLLFAGSLDTVANTTLFGKWGQTPNLWWPEDRTWCVASEIDLSWTYVGGSSDLVESLVVDDQIEALAVGPGGSLGETERWVVQWVDRAVDELLATGESAVVTPIGKVSAYLTQPGLIRGGMLRTVTSRSDGSGGSSATALGKMPPEVLRRQVASHVTSSVVGLAE